MGKYRNRTYPLRLDNEIMDKLKIISEIEDRPISRIMTKMAKEYIKAYEDEHGEIVIGGGQKIE